MVALALDIGGTRTGIAVSDRTGRVAMPLKVLPACEVEGMARSFRMILEDHEPDVLVCGLPQTMSGTLQALPFQELQTLQIKYYACPSALTKI